MTAGDHLTSRSELRSSSPLVEVELRHFHLACGIGGGAKGFNRGTARVGNLVAKFRCIGGIDNNPAACRDFERIAGAKATCLDLFDRPQYVAFHGREPPPEWREATTADYHRAAGNERPHIVFASFPCKGFSGLLSETASKTAKYQALNRLTLRGIWMALESWKGDPVELFIFENVPRIATRGRAFLDQIVQLFHAYGYAVAETTHDCGEIGNLAQSRKRFLLVARHRQKVPNYLYEPERHRLRGVGEVLDALPMPLSGLGGPMHRMPALQWKTWVRLAFVEAGSDWRSLNRLAIEDGMLRDFGITADAGWNGGVLGVRQWGDTSGVVAGRSSPTNGNFSVADPRPFPEGGSDFHGLRVVDYEEPAGAITTQRSPGSSAQSVADPRIEGRHHGVLGVQEWDEAAGVISGGRPTTGRFAVADPRVDGHPKSVQLGVRPWDEPAGVVTGKMFAGGGPHSVADPRIWASGEERSDRGKTKRPRFNNVFRIVPWSSPAPAVAGPGGPAGGLAVADPRPADNPDYKQVKYRVTGYEEPAGTVISASTTGNGAFCVADPRYGWDGAHENKMAVRPWADPAKTVTGSDRVGSGAQSVADPRPDCLKGGGDSYASQGHYGVVPWGDPSGAVPAFAKNNNGKWSVADPRAVESRYDEAGGAPVETVGVKWGEYHQPPSLPDPAEQLVCVIRALDGTWHRPFTTLELAALQSLVDPEEFLELDGLSDAAWRERIGNMVPPESAKAIAGVMGRCLLLAMSGETFALSSEPIWVQPVAVALMAAP